MNWIRKSALIVFLGIFCITLIPKSYRTPSEKHPIIFYANQCDDEIRTCFIHAIRSAKTSILLYIYSLNDREILKALQEKLQAGISIKIVVDKDHTRELKALETVVFPKDNKSGLMHQKILVIDGAQVWIGSANFTSSSLRAHDNLVIALHSPEMASNLMAEKGGVFWVDDQKLELYLLPSDRQVAFERVVELLDQTQKSLEIAMFTWTHPILTQKVMDASKRNVSVRTVLDQTSSNGVSNKSMTTMVNDGIFLKINSGSPLLHHKFAYIDQSILIMGSTNWTKAAFSKNNECILIIHNLKKSQCKKLDQLCHALRSTAKSAIKSS